MARAPLVVAGSSSAVSCARISSLATNLSSARAQRELNGRAPPDTLRGRAAVNDQRRNCRGANEPTWPRDPDAAAVLGASFLPGFRMLVLRRVPEPKPAAAAGGRA